MTDRPREIYRRSSQFARSRRPTLAVDSGRAPRVSSQSIGTGDEPWSMGRPHVRPDVSDNAVERGTDPLPEQ